jgi:hypothetical protein
MMAMISFVIGVMVGAALVMGWPALKTWLKNRFGIGE